MDIVGQLKSGDVSFSQEIYTNTAFSWIGIIAYALQIYLDFSAYSDMAIGMGRMIGIHYTENFPMSAPR